MVVSHIQEHQAAKSCEKHRVRRLASEENNRLQKVGIKARKLSDS